MSISTFLLYSVGLLLLVLYLCHRWQHRHILSAAANLPFPTALPILGNAMFLTESSTSITKKLTELALKYKQLFCIWMGPLPIFVVSRPEDAKIILNTSNALEKDTSYKYLKPYMGNGIITGPVPLWKKYRRLISPVFHPSNLETFIPVFNDVSRDLVNSLVSGDPSTPVNPKPALCVSVVNAGVKSILGGEINIDDQVEDDILYLFHCVGTSFVTRLFNPVLHFDWMYKKVYQDQVEKSMRCLSKIKDVIKQNISKYNLKMMEDSEKVISTDINPLSLLHVIHNDTVGGLTNDHWSDEIITVLAGATDTVISSMSLLLVTLANHPDIQDKVYHEIQEITGSSMDDLNLQDLKRMQYLEQVILESMRLHSAIPMILRKVTRPVKIGETVLPTGSRVMVFLHAMGWDPEVFPEPHRFIPERFLPDQDQKTRPIDMFMPYSAGPRNCIGKAYSMLLMKSLVVHILRQYRILTQLKMEDIQYDLKIVMYTKNPLLITLKKR